MSPALVSRARSKKLSLPVWTCSTPPSSNPRSIRRVNLQRTTPSHMRAPKSDSTPQCLCPTFGRSFPARLPQPSPEGEE
jgi:hypothetical protein